MRDMSEADKATYQKKCSAIKVIVYDLAKMSKELTKQLNANPDFAGKNFEVREKKLALIVGQDMIADPECCFYANIANGVAMDVYEEKTEIKKPDGNTSWSIPMFPSCTVTLMPEHFKEFISEETTLDLFMGDRFIYNARVVGNIDYLISKLK